MSIAPKAIILYDGSQGFRHRMLTKFGIPNDHEIYKHLIIIRTFAELRDVDTKGLPWAVYPPVASSSYWYNDILEPCRKILGPEEDLDLVMVRAIIMLLSEHQLAIK